MFWDLGGDKENELVNHAITVKGNPDKYCIGDVSLDAINASIKQYESCAAATEHDEL